MSHTNASTCPRCGYNLRGTIETWTQSCPITGRCNECGLTFEWADIFDRTRKEPAWCIEYARPGVRPTTRAILATFFHSWLPWLFWSRLRMHHRARFGRLMLYACATVILPAILLYITIQTAAAVIVCHALHGEVELARQETATMIAGHEARIQQWQNYQQIDDVPERELADAIRDVQHLRTVRIDGRPVRRWQVPPQSREEWIHLRHAVIERSRHAIEWDTARLDQMEIDVSYPRTIFAAIFTPRSDRAIGHKRTHAPTSWQLTPRELHELLLRPQHEWLWFPLWGRMRDAGVPAFCWIAAMLFFPMTFVLLPITMRRARVRPMHIARIIIYGAWIPLFVLWLAAAIVAVRITGRPQSLSGQGMLTQMLIMAGPLPLLMAWWYCAIRWHLQLRFAFLIVLILSILTGLILLFAAIALFSFTF